MKVSSFKKFSKNSFLFAAIVLLLASISYACFSIYLVHVGSNLVQNWLQIEEVDIQQGNIFTSISSNNRLFMSSGLIRSVMLFSVDGKKVNEVASFGEYMNFVPPPPSLQPGEIKTEVFGLYSTLTFVRFKERDSLLAVFKTSSPNAALLFLFMLGMLILVVVAFAIIVRLSDQKEESRRLLVIKEAMDNLIAEKDPAPILLQSVPHLAAEWDVLKRRFEALKTQLENAARDRFVAQASAMISHDLRGPLGIFERLLSTADEDLPRMRGAIAESVKRLYTMVEAIRYGEVENLIKKSTSRINFPFGRESLQGKADDYHIDLQIPLEDFGAVYIDQMKVERAWMNLTSNAIEAAKSFVRVEVEKVDNNLFIRVIDDGPGVPDEFLPRLFQRGATHGKHDGTGLGLAYARQIMRGHGGDVTYRRENGMTVFECYLPNAVVAAESKDQKIMEEQRVLTDAPAAVKTVLKQVSISFVSSALSQRVFDRLSKISQDSYHFVLGTSQESTIVLTDSEEIADQLPDKTVRPILMTALSDDEIVRRAPIRLGIKG